LFGFDVWIDASWLLLAALVSWTLAETVFPELEPHLTPETYWSMAVATTIGLLFSIVFHETAHSLVARKYGIRIRGITLFVFGGVAEMESEPPSPRSELLMAAAGPAASFALSIGFLILARRAGSWHVPEAVHGTLRYLGLVNGVLALFNLVPAFPLDGGRILRAALWSWRGNLVSATRIAAGAGSVFGIVLMVLGVAGVMSGDFVGGMWRFLIGMFLRSAATMTYRETVARGALSGFPVARVMNCYPITVPPDTSVAAFTEEFVYRHHHRRFPVTERGLLIGTIGTEQAAAIERSAWATTAVSEIMMPCSLDEVVAPRIDALAALRQMQVAGRSRLWVVDEGRLVGILSLHDMLEVLSARIDLERMESRPRPQNGSSRRRRIFHDRGSYG